MGWSSCTSRITFLLLIVVVLVEATSGFEVVGSSFEKSKNLEDYNQGTLQIRAIARFFSKKQQGLKMKVLIKKMMELKKSCQICSGKLYW